MSNSSDGSSVRRNRPPSCTTPPVLTRIGGATTLPEHTKSDSPGVTESHHELTRQPAARCADRHRGDRASRTRRRSAGRRTRPGAGSDRRCDRSPASRTTRTNWLGMTVRIGGLNAPPDNRSTSASGICEAHCRRWSTPAPPPVPQPACASAQGRHESQLSPSDRASPRGQRLRAVSRPWPNDWLSTDWAVYRLWQPDVKRSAFGALARPIPA